MHALFNLNVKARILFGTCLFLLLSSCIKENKTAVSDLKKTEQFYKEELQKSISHLDSLLHSNAYKRHHYLEARNSFKTIEPILSFVEKHNYKTLNQPNLLKVEEEDATAIIITEPFGFQVLEEQLFVDSTDSMALVTNVQKTRNRLQLVLSNTTFQLEPYHILWLIRDQVVRTATMGITGIDSPVLERSLEDARFANKGISVILNNYETHFKSDSLKLAWVKSLEASNSFLQSDFNEFDRYNFIKDISHHQLKLVEATKKDWGVKFPYALALHDSVVSLFAKETFNRDFFSALKSNDSLRNQRALLGELLFNDTRLSKDQKMSCATCHKKELAFTDGLKSFEKQIRNTPTLKYAGFQKGFFHDSRAGSLEGQIVGVMTNPNEFHTDLAQLITVVQEDSTYFQLYKTAYLKTALDDYNLRHAIAEYIRNLAPFNSKFDKNINGEEQTLSTEEINGFNLFMGKAKCATCHFAPLFNGTIPPFFDESELEVLGVPYSTKKPIKIDSDLGRYNVFNTEEKKHYFKTPTVRNVDLTGPYMHNGVYTTLEEVLDFYNNGGGVGLGIEVGNQTLASDSLKLSQREIDNIIRFMKTLNDL